MAKKANILSGNITETSFASKMLWINNAYEDLKIFMIGVCSIEEKSFSIVSNNFVNVLGDRYTKFKNEGWDFWYSIVHPKESDDIKNRISNFLDNCLIDCQ